MAGIRIFLSIVIIIIFSDRCLINALIFRNPILIYRYAGHMLIYSITDVSNSL